MSTYVSKSSGLKLPSLNRLSQRGWIVGIILIVALFAFEIFNFDTTQFALESLLGNVTFLSIKWATILAIAFCAIDFAGLTRLFSPDGGQQHSKEIWYLMGAWLLGATMNAVMTWWAVSLTLLNNGFGNEVLSREQLLRFVPIFVAVLVWLTRIMFIGSFTIAGGQLFGGKRSKGRRSKASSRGKSAGRRTVPSRAASPQRAKSASAHVRRAPRPAPKPQPVERAAADTSQTMPSGSTPARSSRVRQRPPVPNGGMRRSNAASNLSRHN